MITEDFKTFFKKKKNLVWIKLYPVRVWNTETLKKKYI